MPNVRFSSVIFGGSSCACNSTPFKSRSRAPYLALKRMLDVLVASFLIVSLAPLFALISIAIVLDSPGPIIFKQPRVGCRWRRGKGSATWERSLFHLYKFRSMVADADEAEHLAHVTALVANPGAGEHEPAISSFKLVGDPRITRVGKVLRRTSLDELAQLVNVVRGEMSLVGPRPLPPYEVELHEDRDATRLTTWPGMTGLWQVRRQSAGSYEDMLSLDREYVRCQSLRLDLKILFSTFPAVLRGRGAE